jgi:hypothetical protein
MANFNEESSAKAKVGFQLRAFFALVSDECSEQSSIHQPRALGELTGTPPTGRQVSGA